MKPMSTPQEMLAEVMTKHGITITSTFVPWSKSRNAKPNPKTEDRSLNWLVQVCVNGCEIISTHYMAGIAYCPSYKFATPNERRTLAQAEAIARETETGRRGGYGKHITPNSSDVFWSLLQDADAIDHSSFEEWADNFGYDTDSRKAETSYRQCLDIGLRLRAALGDEAISEARTAAQDY